MCPIVPTFTCGFVRSYFALAIPDSPRSAIGSVARHFSPAPPRRRGGAGGGCAPPPAPPRPLGPQPQGGLRLALRPRDVLRLATLFAGSPRTAGPQPRDVLRLAQRQWSP